MTAINAEKLVPIFIDQQKFEVEPGTYTAAQLLILAGENPSETTLVLRVGNELKRLDAAQQVDVKPGSQFVVFHSGPTPVS